MHTKTLTSIDKTNLAYTIEILGRKHSSHSAANERAFTFRYNDTRSQLIDVFVSSHANKYVKAIIYTRINNKVE